MPAPQPQQQPPTQASHIPGTRTPGSHTPSGCPPTKPNPMRGLSEYAVADTPATAGPEYAGATDYWEARPVVSQQQQTTLQAQEGLSTSNKAREDDGTDGSGREAREKEEEEGKGTVSEARGETRTAEAGAVKQGQEQQQEQDQKQDRGVPTTAQAQDIPSVPRPINSSSSPHPQHPNNPPRTGKKTPERCSNSPYSSTPFGSSPNGGQMGGRRRRESTMIADGIDESTTSTADNHRAKDSAMGARGRRESIMGAGMGTGTN